MKYLGLIFNRELFNYFEGGFFVWFGGVFIFRFSVFLLIFWGWNFVFIKEYVFVIFFGINGENRINWDVKVVCFVIEVG